MLRKLILSIAALSCVLSVQAANWKDNITMLVIPREPVLIQIAQDISRRYPVLLVCYQQRGEQLSIHAWNSKNWVPISKEDYAAGTFFKNAPKHAVIVEKEEGAAADVLIPDGTWCAHGNRLVSTDPRTVIHLLGRHFDFSYSHWMQFCRRYDYALEAVNPSLINVYWWHYKGEDVLPALEARDYKADMDKWVYINITDEEQPGEDVEQQQKTDAAVEDLFETPETTTPEPKPEVELESETSRESIETPAQETAEPVSPEPASDEAMEEVVETENYVAVSAPTPAPIAEVAPPTEEPVEMEDVDPFSSNDIPAAKIILPNE